MHAGTDPGAGSSRASEVRAALETWQEHDLQAMVDLARDITSSPMATITVLDDAEFHFLVCSGGDPFCTDYDDAMCKHSMGVESLFEVPDTLLDARMAGLPFVDGRAASLRFYASTPIYGAPDVMVGRFCVFDVVPRELEDEQARLLTVLADAAGKLIQRELDSRAQREAPTVDYDVIRRAAHDLSAPIAAAAASVELLEEVLEAEPESVEARLLHTGRSALERGRSLLQASLDTGREPVLHPTEFALAEVMGAVRDDLAPAMLQHGATLAWGDLPTVHADRVQLHRVLQNLAGNAIKFARPDVPQHVTVTADASEDGWIVRVRDQGRGIAPQDRERVFEMFTRLTNAPGHGIGLSIVKQVVAAHGGEVGIGDNPVGTGAEIWFTLPSAVSLPAQTRTPEAQPV